MRLVHGIVAYLLMPYTILHVILQWFFGRFWTIFKAQIYQPHLRAGLVSLAIVLPVIAGLYLWNEVPETLTVVHATGDLPAPVLDGDPSDAAWSAGEGRDHPHGQGREQPARPRGRDGEGPARRQAASTSSSSGTTPT